MKHIPQDARKAETKKKLVDAAMALFSTKGYYQTNSKEIALGAGLAVGSFYRHFSDKKDVLKYILETYVRDAFLETNFPEKLTTAEDRKASLKELIQRCFDLHYFSPGFSQQVTLLSSCDEEIRLVFNDYKQAIFARINNFIAAYAPKLPADITNAACLITYSAIEGTIHDVKFSNTGVDEALYIEELVRFVDAYLSDIAPVKGQ